ncbi:MAG: aminotransferase class I/II-fold pyridoxal phosphate-dependent enzyme [Gemmatimonadota bacterium]
MMAPGGAGAPGGDASAPSLSRYLESLPAYPLSQIPEIRRELEGRGIQVLDLGTGDADLTPPPQAVEALQLAVADPGFSRYPFQLGLPAFREAVVEWMAERFGVELDPYREILPLIGSKEGLAHLAFTVLSPGDAAMFPDPGYRAYLGGIVLAGGVPRPAPLLPEHDFRVPLEPLEGAAGDDVRLLYLNYPGNPTGATVELAELQRAVDICRSRGIVLAHDAAYSEIAFDGYRPPSVLQAHGARDVALEFHSLSKTYNMTGWRLGWAAGSARLIAALSRVKTFLDTGAFLGVQAGGTAALKCHADWVPRNVAQFQLRRDAAVEALRRGGYTVEWPRGGLYLWVPIPTGESSEAFALRALEQEGVVVLPGSGLGEAGEGFFRVALTLPPSGMEEAGGRLGRLLG